MGLVGATNVIPVPSIKFSVTAAKYAAKPTKLIIPLSPGRGGAPSQPTPRSNPTCRYVTVFGKPERLETPIFDLFRQLHRLNCLIGGKYCDSDFHRTTSLMETTWVPKLTASSFIRCVAPAWSSSQLAGTLSKRIRPRHVGENCADHVRSRQMHRKWVL